MNTTNQPNKPHLEVPKMATTSNTIRCHPPIPATPQHIKHSELYVDIL